MCDGGTSAFAIAGLVMSLIGTGVSVYSSVQEGKAQQEYYNYQAQQDEKNAKIAEQNALKERQGGIEDARMQRIKTLQTIGKQQTAMASNGIDITSGSALDMIEDTRAMGELDALNILANSERTAQNYLQQSDNFTSQAYLNSLASKNAYKTGIYNSIGAGISGIGSSVQGLGNFKKVNDKWTYKKAS